MNKQKILLILLAIFLALAAALLFRSFGSESGSASNSVVIKEEGSSRSSNIEETPSDSEGASADSESSAETRTDTTSEPSKLVSTDTSREIRLSESISLPLSGSAPTVNVKHSLPIEDIRRGCFRQDCIPSVDDPEFISAGEANELLPDDTVGIGLEYEGVRRFYPFNMLVTREIVNDVVAGDPLLVTYCPLCSTGIVFERRVGDTVYEFGVSGMLWQSNLLMYNRANDIKDRNLWSQVLGEAVVGEFTGTKLTIIPSNIVRYTDWSNKYPDTEVLNTGRIGDPYGGNYYGVARSFDPDFDESTSPLDPSVLVHGVEIGDVFKAYPDTGLPVGTTVDTVNGVTLTIERNDIGEVSIENESGENVPFVSGFWFSWVAAYPQTQLWEGA